MRQSSMISLGRGNEISRFSEELEAKVMKKKCRRGCSEQNRSRSNPRIFAMIAKISLGLRKFRNHSKHFAILAKLGNLARLAKFR